MMQLIRVNNDAYLTLSANSLHTVRWWVDASYAVNPDMKSHGGGCMSLGTGFLYGTSRKHRMNTKISSVSEIVSADDVLPQMRWTLYFIEAQGYKMSSTAIYYTKTTKAQSCWRPMDKDQVRSTPATLMKDISSLQTGLNPSQF